MVDETKFRTDLETEKLTHDSYTEFKLKQLIAEIKKGQKITIILEDENDKELARERYIAKYVNCHANFVIQDKGEKTQL